MKLSYNVQIPSGTKLMGKELEAFYNFYDSENQTMCFEFETDAEAKKCSRNLSGAKYRRELNVEIKKVGNKVYVWKVAGK